MKFVEDIPTLPRGGKYNWDGIKRDLMENPGKWGLVEAEGTKTTRGAAQGTARAIRSGERIGTKAGLFEATTRGTDVWARYVGDEEEQAQRVREAFGE